MVRVREAVKPISTKVPPWFAEMVDAEAQKQGYSRYQWIQKTVATALGVEFPLKRTGDDRHPWED